MNFIVFHFKNLFRQIITLEIILDTLDLFVRTNPWEFGWILWELKLEFLNREFLKKFYGTRGDLYRQILEKIIK